jgi:hypothetical protein
MPEQLSKEALEAEVGSLGADVLRERERAYGTTPSEAMPIVTRDLKKVFPAFNGVPPKVAVQNMSIAVSKGECFGWGHILRSPCRHAVSCCFDIESRT